MSHLETIISKLREDLGKNEVSTSISIYDNIIECRKKELTYEHKDESGVDIFVNRISIDGVLFDRILFQIKTGNNSKIKNIDIIMNLIKQMEQYLISIDSIKVAQQDGLYYVDMYRKI